jgi:hypothetical protein
MPSRPAHDSERTELAPGFTVADYRRALMSDPPDRETIVAALRARFTTRYVEAVLGPKKHGFAIMAVSCLMIEALESLIRGWPSSRNKSEQAFCSFFDRFDSFGEFRGHASHFYKHVRCGILHQAEVTGGWRIQRNGPLFEPAERTINASRFMATLHKTMHAFFDDLSTKPWDGEEWAAVRKKMDAIVTNCRVAS